MNWLFERLKEPSTWMTLVTLAAGMFVSNEIPQNRVEISNAVITALSAIGFFTKEK